MRRDRDGNGVGRRDRDGSGGNMLLQLLEENFAVLLCTLVLLAYAAHYQGYKMHSPRGELASEIERAHELDRLEREEDAFHRNHVLGGSREGSGDVNIGTGEEQVVQQQERELPALSYGPAGFPKTPEEDLEKNPTGFEDVVKDNVMLPGDNSNGDASTKKGNTAQDLERIEIKPDGKLDIAAILKSPLGSRIIVSQKLNAMYCPVPKVACSNWKSLFRRLEGFRDYKDLGKAHDRTQSGLTYLKDFTEEQVREMLNDASMLKFVFVRDPFSRLLSAYLDKFVNRDPESLEFMRFFDQLMGYRFRAEGGQPYKPSFDEYISRVDKQEFAAMNEHWASQVELCQIHAFPYDFVGRFEAYEEDARSVLASLGQRIAFPTQSQINFASMGTANHLDDYYTETSRALVASKFKRDFDLLKYPTSS